MKRRDFLRISALGTAGGFWSHRIAESASAWEGSLDVVPALTTSDATKDEAFWRRIRTFYAPPTEYLDLDHANTSPTATPVFDEFARRTRWMSHAPAERFGTLWEEAHEVSRPAIAAHLGTRPEWLAFVTNATTGLNTVLHGYPLERGDEILVTDHEYPDMIETIRQRERREGIVMRVVPVPGPDENGGSMTDRVAAAITPRTRLLLISHVSAWSGEILPVADITAAARARGVAVLVDAAQSVGMLDVGFDRIGCDFLAASLHKWLGAPVPTGVLVMRPEHVGKVEPLHPPSWDTSEYPMDLYEWSGTGNMAAHASVGDAVAFQRMLGADRKRARMRYLGNHWQDAVRGEPRIRLLTPQSAERSFGVAAVAVEGVPSRDLARHLRDRAAIRVQDKAGRHSPYTNAVRVSPGPCTTPGELDRLVEALVGVARDGLPGLP